MTLDKHRKKKIRLLAQRMGTSYSAARHAFLNASAPPQNGDEPAPPELASGEGAASLPGRDVPLATFQDSALAGSAFALGLGPKAHQLLNGEVASDERPTASHRRLQVALLWGDTVVDVRQFDPKQTVTVGPSAAADFRVYDASIPEQLVLVRNGRVCLPEGARLAVYRGGDGTASPLEDGAELELDDRALVSLASTQLIVRWVQPVRVLRDGISAQSDLYFSKVLSVAFIAHLVLMLGFWISPRDQENLSEDLFHSPGPMVSRFFKAPPPPRNRDERWKVHPNVGDHQVPHPTAKSGPPHATRERATSAKPGGRSLKESRDLLMAAGLLPEAGALQKLFGGGGNRAVNEALLHLGNGRDLGTAHGLDGFGPRGGSGAGMGGGGGPLDIGTGWGTGWGGGGNGGGPGSGVRGALTIGGGRRLETAIHAGKTNVVGALSKEVIAAIVRKHENEIRYCYESQLSKDPGLYGKVAVAFTIGGTGAVGEANVTETTMNDAAVENCMATKIRRWTFPEPQGGGEVFVTYPWIFKSPSAGE